MLLSWVRSKCGVQALSQTEADNRAEVQRLCLRKLTRKHSLIGSPTIMV